MHAGDDERRRHGLRGRRRKRRRHFDGKYIGKMPLARWSTTGLGLRGMTVRHCPSGSVSQSLIAAGFLTTSSSQSPAFSPSIPPLSHHLTRPVSRRFPLRRKSGAHRPRSALYFSHLLLLRGHVQGQQTCVTATMAATDFAPIGPKFVPAHVERRELGLLVALAGLADCAYALIVEVVEGQIQGCQPAYDVSPLDGTPSSSPPTPFHHCWPPEHIR